MRLDGPLQAWGVGSMFERRSTEPWPTKSGLIGLAAAALGLPRDADLSRLAALDVAVRVDQPGRVVTDFHTAGVDGWVNGDGVVVRGQCKMSTRQYLADAVFVAGLGGTDAELMIRIGAALRRPRFHPFLGRRACPPAAPIWIDTIKAEVAQAVAAVPYQGRARRAPARLLMATTDPAGLRVADNPVSFAPLDRRYGLRGVSTSWVNTVATDDDPYGMEEDD